MTPLNIVEIETPRGFRAFELYQSDICELDFDVDLLVVSAFAGEYVPVPRTLIGSLSEKCGLDVEREAEFPWLDFRSSLGCWISRDHISPKIHRLLGVELIGGDLDIKEALSNVFVTASIAEMKGAIFPTLAMPVLGAGNQKIDAAEVIRIVLPKALKFLEESAHTERVAFVEVDPQRAELLSNAMNETLGRIKVVLPKGHLVSSIRKDVLAVIAKARTTALVDGALLGDLRRVVESEDSRSFEIGIVVRRLAEQVADMIVGPARDIDLFRKIEDTAAAGVAPWTRSYLHILRVFGNEAAHERIHKNRIPNTIDPSDMALCLFCLQRTLEFYIEWQRKGA